MSTGCAGRIVDFIFNCSSLTFRRTTKKTVFWQSSTVGASELWREKKIMVSSTLCRSNVEYLSRTFF